MENQPFLLVELEDLSAVFAALKTTSRIKYTCFSASKNYLIFGATSGGLYVFHREPCCFLQILPNKEGSVTQVAISPDEKLIAFSTIKGLVCVLEKSSHGAKNLLTTSEHQNEQVTCLQWNEGSNELFIGDYSGKVSIVTVSIFPTKSMFQNPSFVLMQLDSKIVQMDFSLNMLLVSTLTKCYICDTTKEVFRQVGHKLRDGEYGACIFNTQIKNETVLDISKADSDKNSDYQSLSHLKLLCARPGSRIWEVAIDGTVISTHQFKEALAVPPKKIYFLNKSLCKNNVINNSIISNGTCEQIHSNLTEQSFNFQKLYVILPKFFLTYKSDGIYIFDPEKASVVLWNNEICNIVDVKCVDDVIYVWSGYGKMYALNLVPLEKFLVRLYFQKKYFELAELCLEYESFLLVQANSCSKLHVLHDLDEKLKSDELNDRLKLLINLFKENAQKKIQNAQKLQSGIYLVNNNDQKVLEDKRITYQKYLRPSYLNLKGRSHSVSPERLQNGELRHQGSCSSLPDLAKDEKLEETISPSCEVVVNGRKPEEVKVDSPKIEVENVLKNLAIIKKSSEVPDETVFNFFEKIMTLSDCSKLETGINLELVRPLPFNMYFAKDDLKLIANLFHSALKSKALLGWLSKFRGDWLSQAVKNYPNFLIEHFSNEDLELDYKLSKILKLFSTLLSETEILEIIKKIEMSCYYASMKEILDVYNESMIASVNLENVISTPKLLNRMYFLINVGQIEQCSKYSYKIDLVDILYLMLKFEEKSNASEKSSDLVELQCHTMFLTYLEKASDDNNLITNCSDIVEIYIVNCLENIINTASRARESDCSCGFPNPSHQPSIAMFPNIGHALLDKNWPKNPEKCLKICGRVPYLWKYLIYLRRNEPLPTLLPLLIQTGEIQELENRSEEVNEAILETYLKNLIILKSGNCLNCGKKLDFKDSTISWTTFGTLCIKLLGPRETLELYQKYSTDISFRDLNQTFYQSLIFSAIMERHSKGLRKNVVDLLTGRGTEESNRMSIFSEKLKEEIFGRSCLAESNFQSDKFNSHHWGVKVNFKNNCAVCSLPLETKVLISEAGLVVFKCAHVFHSACLRKVNLECPVCKKKLLTNEMP